MYGRILIIKEFTVLALLDIEEAREAAKPAMQPYKTTIPLTLGWLSREYDVPRILFSDYEHLKRPG